MMNLQITVPYTKCTYNCPFCIARNHTHQERFGRLSWDEYSKALVNAITNHDIKTVVITGATEPSLRSRFVHDLVTFLRLKFDKKIKIEVQTRNPYFESKNADVMAYSCSTGGQVAEVLKPVRIFRGIVRVVVIVNSYIDISMIDWGKFRQVTFKKMQLTEDAETNEWIKDHDNFDRLFIESVMRKYPDTSFVIDEDCQSNNGRYLIFRNNGKLYRNWEDKKPVKGVKTWEKTSKTESSLLKNSLESSSDDVRQTVPPCH